MKKKPKIRENPKIYNQFNTNNSLFQNMKDNYFNEDYFDNQIYQREYNQISKAELYKSSISEHILESFVIDKRIKDSSNNSLNSLNSLNSYFIDKDNDSKSISTTVSENRKSFNFKKVNQIKEQKIRKSYYTKLIHKNIYSENILKKLNYNIFIIDWDDTFFPTTFLNKDLNTQISKEIIEDLDKMESIIIELITKVSRKGYVFIVTNSNKTWAIECIDKYYPNMKSILKKIDIISARDLYEKKFPSDAKKWKEKTFLKIKKDFEFQKENIINIICIGDSEFEIDAGKNLAKEFNNSVIKSIKLKKEPNLKEIMKEINWLNKEINEIFICAKNMSVFLE